MSILNSALVPKFVRATSSQYATKKATYDNDGTIFWCTDIPVIYANGVKYAGLHADTLKEFDGLKSVSLNEETNEIEFVDFKGATKKILLKVATDELDGLMSSTDKAKLDALPSNADLNNKLTNASVESKNSTITVTPGTGSNKTNIEVNVDGETIVVGTGGKLKVDATKVAPEVSGTGAIKVDDAATSGKEVSLTIPTDEKVLSQDTSGLKTTLSVKKVTDNLATNVKEAYIVVGKDGSTALGDPINIYKDSSLLSVKLLHAAGDTKPTYTTAGGWTDIVSASQTETNLALCFAYETTTGSIEVEAVAVGDFLRESEFKNGLEVSATGEVSVKKAADSEDFLYVTADGVAVKGVQDAIDAAKSALLGNATTAGDTLGKLEAKINAVSGAIEGDLSAAIAEALGELDADPVGGAGKYIESIEQEDGVITATEKTLNAAAVAATASGGFTATNTTTQSLLTEIMEALTWRTE